MGLGLKKIKEDQRLRGLFLGPIDGKIVAYQGLHEQLNVETTFFCCCLSPFLFLVVIFIDVIKRPKIKMLGKKVVDVVYK